MVELFAVIMEFLNSIPTNAAMLLIIGIIGWLIKYQSKKNDEIDQRFEAGVINFSMIDKHFEEVKNESRLNTQITESQFSVLHEQIKSVHKMVLKDIIYNDSMDLLERQEAYDEYVNLGGNGFTQRYYENILKPKIEAHIKEGNR